MLKRILDVCGAFAGLVFILPFTPFIALAIVLDSGWPVFVRLDRVSEGKVFKMVKFRTMVRGAHGMKPLYAHLNERKDGPFFKIKNDPRLTKVGKWLRKLRVDEFPQFWNVLTGDISLVGPRPYPPEEVAQYPTEFQRLRFAKAGLTGLAQIMGASELSFKKTMEYDLYYLDHRSFWLDLKILAKTVLIFFTDPTGV
jgi:lipopolysaccharide/colanic/teichoic acid biosynthesis glycosyltransferase